MMPQTIVRRVRSGEEKSRSGWAREFGKNVKQIDNIFSGLRRRGYLLYPVGTEYHKEGIIKEVVKRPRDYRETSERIANNFTKPHVKAAYRLREQYLLQAPERRVEIEMTATEFVKFVQEQSRKLLGK